MTVVETERFLKDTASLLSESQRSELVAHLGSNPEAGQLMPNTGGVRKIRWSVAGRGKRGGARIIYYFHNAKIPLFLLTAYAKNEKPNLTPAECAMMRKLVQLLVASYGTKK